MRILALLSIALLSIALLIVGALLVIGPPDIEQYRDGSVAVRFCPIGASDDCGA